MAYLAEPKNPRVKRHPLWCLESFLEDLSNSKSTITQICKRYAGGDKNWRAYYNDVRRWMNADESVMARVKEHIKETDSKKRDTISGGRPTKDSAETSDWRVLFCEELLRTKSRVKAALVTPYTPDEIYQKLSDKYSSYDKDFSELVHQTEMRLVAWAEEEIWTALGEATNPKDKAWIAKEILKVRDRQRWGDKLDVSVDSRVTHRHEFKRSEVFAQLVADQQKFFSDSVKSLPENTVVDAEIVDE